MRPTSKTWRELRPVDPSDPDTARVLAGHGLNTPPRPGGLLGPLPKRVPVTIAEDNDPTTEEN